MKTSVKKIPDFFTQLSPKKADKVSMGNPGTERPTILYVDDQPSHLALFQKAFGVHYRVITSSTIKQALEMVQEERPFLIIADHNMPEMTGVDFLKKTREVSPHHTVRAILSAYIDDGIERDATKQARVMECLKKPWKLDTMRSFIERAHRQYETIMESPLTKVEPIVPDNHPIFWHHLSDLMHRFEEPLDSWGSRQIFMNFVEPRPAKLPPLINRPVHSVLQKAMGEALYGNFSRIEEILTHFLKEESIGSILKETAPAKIEEIN